VSEPIIIETPAPPTRERLVLVPLLAVSRTEGGDELLTIRTANARDATPADLLRAGYVPREVPSAEAWKAAHAAKRELIRARAALAEQPDPGTLAHLRADLRDAVKRAEKAERELRDMSERAGDAERERDEAKELARVLEVERDEGRRLHSEADNAKLRAEVARLTAPGKGSLDNGGLVAAITRGGSYRAEDFDVLDLQAAYRLGVAHERARQQPAKDRATDEELEREYNRARRNGAALGDIDGILAVAARVRKEQCLVAQAVGMGADVRITRSARAVAWDIDVTRRPVAPGARYVHEVKAADVPSTLARLLGEVSK